jgi:hypothetical protein
MRRSTKTRMRAADSAFRPEDDVFQAPTVR